MHIAQSAEFWDSFGKDISIIHNSLLLKPFKQFIQPTHFRIEEC